MRRRDWLTAEEIAALIQLPSDRPHSLLLILEAARIPNPDVVRFAAQELARVVGRCPWVAFHAGLLAAPKLVRQLHAVATAGRDGHVVLNNGAHCPDFFVLSDGQLRPPDDAINLIGLLLLMRLSEQVGVGTGINKTQIKTLESHIRGRTRMPHRTGRWQLAEAMFENADRLQDLADRFTKLRSSISTELATTHGQDLEHRALCREAELVGFLATWTSDFVRFRAEHLKRKYQKRCQRLEEHLPLLALHPDEDGEPPDSNARLLPPLPGEIGTEPLSDAYRSALATRSTRTRNFLFHPVHAEVLLAEQAASVIAQSLVRLKAKKARNRLDKPGCILTLLTAAAGRMANYLVGIRLGESTAELVAGQPFLDLSTGLLHLPPPAPPHIYRPYQSDIRFEHPDQFLALPLPPELVAGLRDFWRANPVTHIGDWIGVHDPERLIRDCLKEVTGCHLHTHEPAALRKWMQCRLFERHRDRVSLMVLCGDTFGLSDAALYYHAPRTCELIEHYAAALWPSFQTGAPPAEETSLPKSEPPSGARSGAASVVDWKVVRAGFNVLSGRLNVSKSRALESVAAIAAYHEAFADYLARRLALVSTQRPRASLYALTRDQFSLATNLAVLQDKNVDPEHFRRLVATTDGLSEVLIDYLVHLRFLAQHPLCSASARDHLLAVCRGERPLIVYLTDESTRFGSRTGSLTDWDRSAPPIWAGLPPNFHRAFTLNSLRETSDSKPAHRLTVEVLAHGGHLDAAGHPFDDDSVIAPADLLRPVSERLHAMERALGLRHAKGFADQFDPVQLAGIRTEVKTPPPLRGWAADLTEHEQVRDEILRGQKEREKSVFRQFDQQAEQWLQTELPLLSPDLARVLRAVSRSDRKAVPADARDVVIPDLDMCEILEQVSLLSSDADGPPSALQVATHNMLSKRIRVAAKRFNLRCMPVSAYRIRYGRGMSPFLLRNPVAVDQVLFLRDHLLRQIGGDQKMPAPIYVAWHLALYDSTISSQTIFEIATGRLALHHLPDRPGVLITQSAAGRPATTLVGLAAMAAGRFSADELLKQSITLSGPVELGRQMEAYCPEALKPADRNRFLDHLLTTAQIAARICEEGLLRTAARDEAASREADSERLVAFHSRALPLGVPGTDVSKTVSVDADGSCLRVEPVGALHRPRDLGLGYERLLYSVDDPGSFLAGIPRRERNSGTPSKRASSAMIREALDLSFPPPDPAGEAKARLNVVDVLGSYARHINDRELRGEKSLEQSSVYTYLTDIGSPLIDVFGSVDLRSLSEDDFDEAYQLVAETIGERTSASRARAQLRHFHDHAVKAFGIAEAMIPVSTASKGDGTDTARKLLSDAHYSAAVAWIVRQLERDDADPAGCARWRRGLLTAGVILVLLRRAGLRINEALWLRFRDLFQIGNRWFVLVAPSHFRGLKTAAARRLIPLEFDGDPVGLGLVERWIRAERLRGAADGRAMGLLFPHLDNPRHTLGDDVIRRLIQLAFQSSSGIEMVPHEVRHLFATDQWTLAIGEGWGGHLAIDLIRALDRVRLMIGHARLTTTSEFYIHHLHFLKLQRLSGLPSRNTLRPVVDLLTTADLGTIDKAWQRSSVEEHVCRDPEAERTRLAVARQSGPIRITLGERVPDHHPVAPTRSKNSLQIPVIVDAWLRAVRTRTEFEALGFGLGFTRSAISGALEVIDSLAGSPTHYRLLESVTRRGEIHLVPRPRSYVPAFDDAMLKKTDLTSSSLSLLHACVRPAPLRNGALLEPAEPACQTAIDQILESMAAQCRRIERGADTFGLQGLKTSRMLTHSFVWNLSVSAIAERIRQTG